MRRGPTRNPNQPDWVVLAQPYDHHLDSADPLWIAANEADEPGQAYVHVHQGMDVGIALSGEMELRYSDVSCVVTPGDVWLGAMWEPHYWRVLRPDTAGVLFVFLPEVLGETLGTDLHLLDMFAVPASQRPRVTTPQLREAVLAIAREVTRECEERRLGWKALARLGLIRLLTALAREWQPRQSGSRPRVKATDLSRIMPALTLANSHLGRHVTPKEAAAACSISRSLFHRLFGRTMGMSYGRFCRRARLAFASHRLLDTHLSVEAIAREAGFVDASHLHRRFVSQYRCTPAEYRTMGRRFHGPPDAR